MSRGQLTYYFRAKEDILLAVFDRMIQTMRERHEAGGGPACPAASLEGWDRTRTFLAFMVLQPPAAPEFHALQYTFLSQVGHRDDFRRRLADLYEQWRGCMTADFAREGRREQAPAVSSRTLASFVQALLHGLAIQRVADPGAYDRQEMLTLCLHLLEGFLGKEAPDAAKKSSSPSHVPRRGKSGRPSQGE
jgi:AcrR family transcriptional regulator